MALAFALILPSLVEAQGVTLPVRGRGTTAAGVPVRFRGLLNLKRFVVRHGVLTAVGRLTGTITSTSDGVTSVLSTVNNMQVRLPVLPQQSTGSCRILDLVLGPLHLDLLGLVVDLNRVHLTITAQRGPGNLLGNLLCAVANLLNGNPLNNLRLAALLNGILGVL